MEKILAWDFIIIGIENQRKWCKSTKNRQKNFLPTTFCNIHLSKQIKTTLRKFFIHRGKIMHTLEHSLRLSEVSPTLGHTLSMVVSWEISTYSFSILHFLIFSHFPSFCPAVTFRLVFPTMTHGCSTDADHPASPRATRAPSLGFCCFCFHYSRPPYGSFSHHWYRRTGASFLCH